MLDRALTASVALSLAILVWLYARSRDQENIDNVSIPVHVSLPASQNDQYTLELAGSPQITVSFTGPPAPMRELRHLLQQGELQVNYTIAVPEDRLNEGRYSDTVRIDPSDIHVPPGVNPVIAEGRNRIPVTVNRIVERRLVVRFDPSLEDRVGTVTIEPSTVLVRGPQEVLDRTRSIATQPYVLPPSPEGHSLTATKAEATVPLVHDIEGRPVQPKPASVQVCLTVQPRQELYELKDVPIHFLSPAGFPYRPRFVGERRTDRVTLHLLGPAGSEPPTPHVYVDLTQIKPRTGLFEEPLRLQLPKDFQLAQSLPRTVLFELQPVDITSQP
jgi:hypothetical protein